MPQRDKTADRRLLSASTFSLSNSTVMYWFHRGCQEKPNYNSNENRNLISSRLLNVRYRYEPLTVISDNLILNRSSKFQPKTLKENCSGV